MILRILTLGDVVGTSSVDKIKNSLWGIRKEEKIDFTVINGENAADGGMDIRSTETLIKYGADVVTAGNHTFKRREIREYLDDNPYVIRPGNFPDEISGCGCTLVKADGVRYFVMNVLGNVFMEPLACPFRTVERMLKNAPEHDVSILDIHAESTSEKIAMAHYFDGKVNIIFGTHTHVQTADIRIMPEGSGYITDLGMCGPENSVLGIKKEKIIEKFLTHMPVKFDISENEVKLHGAIFEYDTDKKRTISAKLFEY